MNDSAEHQLLDAEHRRGEALVQRDLPTLQALVTQVWVRDGLGWKQSSFHSCRVAEPAKS